MAVNEASAAGRVSAFGRIFFGAVLFAAGGVAGWAWGCRAKRPSPAVAERPAEAETCSAAASKPSVADARRARVEALRNRVADLEAKLAAAKSGTPSEPSDANKAPADAAVAEAAAPKKTVGQSRLEYLLKIQVEEPEQFAHVTNTIVRSSRWQRRQAEARIEYLNRADVSLMTDDERAVHEELLGVQEALLRIAGIQSVWDRPAEVEDAVVAEKRVIEERIVELNAAEARTLVRLEALRLGYASDDTEEIADAVSSVLEASFNGTQYTGQAD